jgi:2'-5' RNA ligase
MPLLVWYTNLMKLSIVSYLDPTSSAQVRAIQRELSRVTGSKASLESWEPHITIGDGIDIADQDLPAVQAAFQEMASRMAPFSLELGDIATITNRKGGIDEVTTPYVIYINVNMNHVLLDLVAKTAKITAETAKWYFMHQPYQAHCTLAFRDLTKKDFAVGRAHLVHTAPAGTVTINHVALVKKLPSLDRELVRFPFEVTE